MAKKRKPGKSKTPINQQWWLWAGVLVVVAGVIAYAIVTNNSTEEKLLPGSALGGVTYCQAVPDFALEMGYDTSAIMSTNEREKGLVIYDRPLQPGVAPTRVYRHPSWDQAGYLGTPVNDELGNIFVAPAPRVNLYDNPPEQQNTIFRVDNKTGEMAEFVILPSPTPMSPENPFGIIGLTYDCDTKSLYAASIAGSTREEEVGVVYQIDPGSGAILSQLRDIDAFGMAVFNRTLGKRLYFGLARKSEVWSVALDGEGGFRGRPRFEFSMVGWGSGGDEKARRIVFRKADEMSVRGSLFNYNLIAGSERPQTDYLLRYDPVQDLWLLSNSPQQ
jgi:hypothetical protein